MLTGDPGRKKIVSMWVIRPMDEGHWKRYFPNNDGSENTRLLKGIWSWRGGHLGCLMKPSWYPDEDKMKMKMKTPKMTPKPSYSLQSVHMGSSATGRMGSRPGETRGGGRMWKEE